MLTSYSKISRRYAQSLFELCKENKLIEAIADDIKNIHAVITTSADIIENIKRSQSDYKLGDKIIAVLTDKLPLNEISANFLNALKINNRVSFLPEINNLFLELVLKHNNIVTATVTLAKQITESEKESLVKRLSEKIGSKVNVDIKTNENIIGGIIVNIGSKMWDGSLQTNINNLHKRAKTLIVNMN